MFTKLQKTVGFLGVVIITGGILAACDDGTQNSSTGIKQTTNSTQVEYTSKTNTQEKNWVWPGNPDDPDNMVPDNNVVRNNFMIVYDGSGSMADPDPKCGVPDGQMKHSEGVAAVKAFADAVPQEANLGLLVFDQTGTSVRVKLGESRDKFHEQVKSIAVGQGTPLRSATLSGYHELTAQAQRQFGYGRYSLIIITDGAASSGQDPTRVVNDIVDQTPIEVWAVGFCLGEGHSLNQPGRTFYVSANSPQDLIEGLKGVLAESDSLDITEFSTQ